MVGAVDLVAVSCVKRCKKRGCGVENFNPSRGDDVKYVHRMDFDLVVVL